MKKYPGKVVCTAIMLTTTYLSALTRGTISAQVVDQTGNPVAGARVAVFPADARGVMGALRECLTDDKGICSQDIELGKYNVTAKKTTDGYPDLIMHFYGHGHWPATTEITPEKPAATVTVQLGPRAASIIVHAIDDVSGDAVTNLTVTLHPAADPHDFLSTGVSGPDSTVLIPPDEDVLMAVSADGYRQWHLEEHPEVGPGGVLHLYSQDRREIKVRLRHQ